MLDEFYFDEIIEITNPRDIKNHINPGLYKVKVYSDSSNLFPILPTRIKLNNSDESPETVFYLNGEFTGLYSNEFLDYFIQSNNNNKIIEYKEAYMFKSSKKKKIFESFIKEFLEKKNNPKESLENKNLYKNILNSLAGKLATKPIENE